MALSFHHSTVAPIATQSGISKQALLDSRRVPGIKVEVSRIVISASARWNATVAETDLAWFQVLQGDVQLQHNGQVSQLDDSHVVLLPPGSQATLQSSGGAVLLHATVPGYLNLDAQSPLAATSGIRIVDWTREPILLSEHDARKRVYLVTPTLSGTKAIKGEMIIYPPGTEAANHHHEGAAHFMYILAGQGTCYANEQAFAVREGDIVYYADAERHYLRSDDAVEMRFVEFFVPGKYKTVWAPNASVCTWLPTGKNILGEAAVRHIQAHSSAAPSADI